jgi:hypothetical protein
LSGTVFERETEAATRRLGLLEWLETKERLIWGFHIAAHAVTVETRDSV